MRLLISAYKARAPQTCVGIRRKHCCVEIAEGTLPGRRDPSLGRSQCPRAVLTGPAPGPPLTSLPPSSSGLICCPLSTVAPPCSFSTHQPDGPFKMQMEPVLPLRESLLAPAAATSSLQGPAGLAPADLSTSPSLPLDHSVLASCCCSLAVLSPLLPLGLSTCCSLNLACTPPLVDVYSFFKSRSAGKSLCPGSLSGRSPLTVASYLLF